MATRRKTRTRTSRPPNPGYGPNLPFEALTSAAPRPLPGQDPPVPAPYHGIVEGLADPEDNDLPESIRPPRPDPTPFRTLMLVNAGGFVGLFLAFLEGLPQRLFSGEGTGIIVTILLLFLGGLGAAIWQAYRPAESSTRSRANLRAVRTAASILVMLGLLGTVVGMSATVLSIDPGAAGDAGRAAAGVARALGGLGIGVYATIAAIVGNIWLTVNAAIIDRFLELRA